ncbi:hypothetical protein ACI2OX_03715 [Bacillus sp. N9]
MRKATIYSPNHPDAFYHLSFIFADQDRKWETVIFYGNEALEKGIKGSRKIKLLCNLALAYSRLGYIQKAAELRKEAYKLDETMELEWFIQLYTDRMNKRISEPILLKEPDKKREKISRNDSAKYKEEAMEGKCVVLDLAADEKHFYAYQDAVRLEKREGRF